MSTHDLVLVIDEPHFVVKLHRTLLKADLKKGALRELEDALESSPILRNPDFLFQTVIPLIYL